jgi:hypothetical protein
MKLHLRTLITIPLCHNPGQPKTKSPGAVLLLLVRKPHWPSLQFRQF